MTVMGSVMMVVRSWGMAADAPGRCFRASAAIMSWLRVAKLLLICARWKISLHRPGCCLSSSGTRPIFRAVCCSTVNPQAPQCR